MNDLLTFLYLLLELDTETAKALTFVTVILCLITRDIKAVLRVMTKIALSYLIFMTLLKNFFLPA